MPGYEVNNADKNLTEESRAPVNRPDSASTQICLSGLEYSECGYDEGEARLHEE
jgi:hypothetical protein